MMTRKFVALSLIASCAALTQCSRPRTEAQYLARGKAFEQRGDFPRAALEFKNAARLRPKDAEPEYQLACAYLATGKLLEALSALLKTTQLNPKDARAQTKLAELMIRSGDVSVIRQGQERAQQALAAAPENAEAMDALALSELELGKPGDAEHHLQAALRKFPKNLNSSVELATVYLTHGRVSDAEDVLKRAASVAPKAEEPAVALGELYRLLGRWNDAEAQFRHALEIKPNEPRALLGLAAAQGQLGQRDEAEKTFRIVSDLPEKQYGHLHAVYLFATGQRDAAVKEFESLAKSNPTDRDSRTRLVTAYLLTGRASDAERILNSALKANERDVDALLQLSQILLNSGEPRQAEANLDQVLHYQPDSAEAHYLLSRVYLRDGDKLRQESELTEALHYNPAMLSARTELAQLLIVSKSPGAALELLDAAPASQKQSMPLIIERNLAKLASGDNAGFRAGVIAGLKIARTPNLLLQDATVKLMDRDNAGARRSFEEVLGRNPNDLRALRGVLLCYAADKQPAAAKNFLLEYAAQHRSSAAIQEFAGDWLWISDARAEARAAFTAARAADPHYVPAELDSARVEAADGKLDAAETTLKRVVDSDEDNVAAHLLMAIVETKAAKYPEAIEQYRKVLALSPRNKVALNNLAYLLADVANEPDEALAYAQQALELSPDSADAAGTLGWVFYRKGLYQMAEQYLQQAVSNDRAGPGRNAAIRKYHLAMTYAELGDRQRGAEMLAQARQQDPNAPESKVAEAALQKIRE